MPLRFHVKPSFAENLEAAPLVADGAAMPTSKMESGAPDMDLLICKGLMHLRIQRRNCSHPKDNQCFGAGKKARVDQQQLDVVGEGQSSHKVC